MSTAVENVTKLKFWCQKVLPLAYDDSLSYYEVLCKTVNKINELRDAVESDVERLDAKDSELDGKITAVQNEIDTFEQSVINAFNEYKAETDKNFEQLKKELTDAYAQLESDFKKQFDDLESDFKTQFGQLYNTINDVKKQVDDEMSLIETKISQMRDEIGNIRELTYLLNYQTVTYVNEELEKLRKEIPELVYTVKSPIDRHEETIQEAFDEIFNALSYGSYTAGQFDEQDYTAEEWDGFNLTAYEFDTAGKDLTAIPWYLKIRNPFSGRFESAVEVVKTLCTFHTGDRTAEYIDGLDETAETIDGYDRTAYDWDMLNVA